MPCHRGRSHLAKRWDPQGGVGERVGAGFTRCPCTTLHNGPSPPVTQAGTRQVRPRGSPTGGLGLREGPCHVGDALFRPVLCEVEVK